MQWGEPAEERARLECHAACAAAKGRLRDSMVGQGFPASRLWWKADVRTDRVGWRLVLLDKPVSESESLDGEVRTLAEVYVVGTVDVLARSGRTMTAVAVDHVRRAQMRRVWYFAAGAACAAAGAAALLGG